MGDGDAASHHVETCEPMCEPVVYCPLSNPEISPEPLKSTRAASGAKGSREEIKESERCRLRFRCVLWPARRNPRPRDTKPRRSPRGGRFSHFLGHRRSRAKPSALPDRHLPSARAFVVYPVFANIIVAPAPVPPSRAHGNAAEKVITTELIQKYLDENQTLILAILENQNWGKLEACNQYQARLQQNLMYLAAIAMQPLPKPGANVVRGAGAAPRGGFQGSRGSPAPRLRARKIDTAPYSLRP